MTHHSLLLLFAAGCGPRISGTADAPLPDDAVAMVLWQGVEVLGAEGGSSRIDDGAFGFGLQGPGAPEALGYGLMPDWGIGYVVAVSADFDPTPPIAPDALDDVLAVDPGHMVWRDQGAVIECSLMGGSCRGGEFPFGRGDSCLECADGVCEETTCEVFELHVTDQPLELDFPPSPLSSLGALMYDERGESAIWYAFNVDGGAKLNRAVLGDTRRTLVDWHDVYRIVPTGHHAGQGLITADVEGYAGEFYAVGLDLDGRELWRIEHDVHSLVDGPYLSGDGLRVAWAESDRVFVADARTLVVEFQSTVPEDYNARIAWSGSDQGLFWFSSEGEARKVGTVDDDWPQCAGSPAPTANSCPEDGEVWGLAVFSHPVRTPYLECSQRPYGAVPRAATPPATYVGCP